MVYQNSNKDQWSTLKFKTQQLLPPYSDIHALFEIQAGPLTVFLSPSISTKKAHYPIVFLCSGPEVSASSGNLSEMKNFRLHHRPAESETPGDSDVHWNAVWEPLLCLWQQLSEMKTVLPDETKLMAELSLWLRSCPFLNQYFRRAAFLLPKLKTWPSV